MRTKVTVVIDEKIGTVNPNIFGHFAEHLGRCIYGGIYVGEDSYIPNTRGIRNDVVTALKKISPPVLRWPGGCFADDYHWRDGIGRRDKRPKTINIHWGGVIENNHFGTHEFIDFCRLIGAEPYICLNVGSGSPKEARDWIEYCNFSGGSTLARERGVNGASEPFKVKYWGIGNELWGCGGYWDPRAYATEVKRYLTFIHGFSVFTIACGPRGDNLFELRRDWVLEFFEEFERRHHPQFFPIDGFALHFYTRGPRAGGDTNFSHPEYYWMLRRTSEMEDRILQVRAAMDAYDPQRKVGLVIDEWGSWHPQAHKENGLWQENTVRDALVAALNLDIFVRHADKVSMANIAQTVNVLQAMILTNEEKMLVTPSYHVYDLYKEHQSGTSLRILIDCPDIGFRSEGEELSIPAVSGSASLKDNTLFLTLTNISLNEETEVDLVLLSSDVIKVKRAVARELRGSDVRSYNSFDEPDAVKPKMTGISVKDVQRRKVTLPAHSVSAIQIEF